MGNGGAALQIIRIARGHIILGGALAFALGLLLGVAGGGGFDPLKAALFYAIVFFGDLSTHYSNDYYDVENDRLASHRKVFSGRKILVYNPNLLPTARYISIACLSTSVALSAAAVAFNAAPFELLLIVLGANFLGWFYSAPPLRLVSRGLGEAAIALAAGFAIPAVGYMAAAGRLDWLYGLFALPFVLYGFMLALSLQAPDIEADRIGGKNNVGVRMGERRVFEFAFMTAVAAFACFAVYALQFRGVFWKIAGFAAVPLAAATIGLGGIILRKDCAALSAVNVFSLFGFNLLMITYLVLLMVFPGFA